VGGQSAATPRPARVGSEVAIVDLLQQSHDLDKQGPGGSHLYLLRMQTEQVLKLRPDLARAWANELFVLAQKEGATADQAFAMSILVRLDPDRAIELLHAMDSDPGSFSNAVTTPQMQLAQQVFEALVTRDGESALPIVEREAAFMGSAGRYPYSALGYAASEATSKFWGNNNQHAIQVEQSVLDLAFSRYSQTSPTYFDNMDFGRMLQVLAGGLPLESVQPALHLLVKNLLATDVSKYEFHAEVFTSDGKSAKADNAIDAGILSLGSLMTRDPELVQQLESTRPQLQTALEYAKPGHMRSLRFGGRVGARKPQLPNPDAEAQSDALSLAHINADAAIARAEQLPAGPKRASTLLNVARRIAGDHPEQAANLIAEAKGEGANDDAAQLNIISAEAYVAAAAGNSGLHDLLQQGFSLATRLASEEHGDFAGAPLVQIGIQNEPDLTVAFLRSLPPSFMKAELLMNAAAALNLHGRLPFRSGAQPKPGKSE
jgi:hypothetical protein